MKNKRYKRHRPSKEPLIEPVLTLFGWLVLVLLALSGLISYLEYVFK